MEIPADIGGASVEPVKSKLTKPVWVGALKSFKSLELKNLGSGCLRWAHPCCQPLASGVLALVALFFFLARPAAAATQPDDSYIRGYVSAIMVREFSIASPTVKVKDGVVTLVQDELWWQSRDRLVREISGIPGVVRVEMAGRAEARTAQAQRGAAEEQAPPKSAWFPRDKLFSALIADPRWPHFSLSYLRSVGHAQFKDVASTNFGETFPIYRGDLYRGDLLLGQWEVGIQAGVFAIFDIDTPSKNLQNADYFVGIPLTYRYEGFTALFRFFHQSSHLGDEFLLANPKVTRVNLSYEEPNLILSQEFGGWAKWLRIYGGAGYLVDRDPSSLKPWTLESGLELTSPVAFIRDAVRPLAGVDVKNNEDTRWDSDLSAVAGVQFENPSLQSSKLQFLVEYYNGHSPDGQFFQQKTQYTGIGFHFYF
ncbi:MAG: DUF1207 domain-containing protein [Bryobacteraceae bacterium]|jgi:hypothetical protein